MMQVMGHVESVSIAASHYFLSNQILAMQKDEKQGLAIGVLAMQRLYFISTQALKYAPKLANYKISWAPVSLGVVSGVAAPFAKYYLDKNPNPVSHKDKIINSGCKALVKLGNACDFLLKHADNVLNVLCLVNAVALIAFGFPVAGSIALASLCLLALKRYHCLPPVVDKVIEPVTIVGAIASTFLVPMHVIFRIINITAAGGALLHQFLRSKTVHSWLPEHLKNPFHNKHVVKEMPGEKDLVLENLEKPEAFTINTSYVFSDHVGKLLSTDKEQALAQLKTEELFKQLTEKMKESNIVLNDAENEGLNNLKTAALTGRVTDVTPPDIELFKTIIKSLVHSILEDKDNFAVRIREFANVGNSCVEGWTRDITVMLSPQTNDIAWAVHHTLAKMRGEVVKEKILNLNKIIPLFDMAGGSNDVHLTNAIQAAFWHRIRTYEGELDVQLKSPSLITYLMLPKITASSNTESPSMLEQFYMGMTMATVHPGTQFLGGAIRQLEQTITPAVFVNDVSINTIYDAIKPEYIPAADGRLECLDTKRKIAWSAVQKWMETIAEKRGINICDPETYEYNPRFVTKDLAGQDYLTEVGVRLLMWDLGILSYVPAQA